MIRFLLILALALFSYQSVFSQFVVTREVKEEIPGLCDGQAVYSLLPIAGQVAAKPSFDKDKILVKLNDEVTFLKDNPKFKSKGMIEVIINCRGEMVYCEMDIKTKNKELDSQVEEVFRNLGSWTTGTLNGEKVNNSVLFSFKIKKGEFLFD